MSFSFGTPSSAPATSALTGGFSFGTNKPATPAFGLSATTQASTGLFGSTTTSAPAFGSSTSAFGATSAAPAFGSTATPAFGTISTPAFGATTTSAFGASTTPAFGSTTTPAFGSTTTPAFGSTTTPAFGSTTTPAFGSTTTPAFGSTTTPAFGATTTSAFGATSTPAFGSTTFGTGGLNFGAGANTSAPSTGLSFGAATTTTASAGLGGFGFGAATTQSTGLFGSTSTATTSTSLFGAQLGTTSVTGTQPSTFVTPSRGLGGLGAPTSGGCSATNPTTSGDGKTDSPKQTKLPNEILKTVDSFKEFFKKQKSLSSEVMQISIKPLQKVARDAEATLRLAMSLSSEVSRTRAHSRRLRSAAAAALAATESVARGTPGTEWEGSAPPPYVKDLISELEQQLITLRRQMDVADKQMQASPRLLTEQELTLGIRRMHESLVALAGRLQGVHAQVDAQKEQYLNFRKYILKDPTNVFETPSTTTSLDQILSDAETSRKKNKTGLTESNYSSAVLSDPMVVLGNIQQLAGPTPFSYVGGPLSSFSAADASGANWQPQTQPSLNTSFNMTGFGASAPTGMNSTFQLQKPPGKRGKQ